MLSEDRLSFMKGILQDGVIVHQSIKLWKGGVSMEREGCDATLDGKAPGASRYNLKYQKRYRLKEFSRARRISRYISRICRMYCYRSRYGLFIPKFHYEEYFENFYRSRDMAYELRDTIIEEKDRILEDLRGQYVDVARALWHKQYGEGKEPTINYINNAAERYVRNFPSNNMISSMFVFEVYPVDPFVGKENDIYQFIDGDRHNMSVYRAFYNDIIKKREDLKKACSSLYVDLFKKGEGERMAGEYKRILSRMSRYVPAMYYDKGLRDLIVRLCDSMIVSDENRSRESAMKMLEDIVNYLNSSRMFQLAI